MRAGKLRHRITIERPIEPDEPAESGERVVTWRALARGVWADVQTPTGRELERARTVDATVTHTIQIRYRADLAEPNAGPRLRVRWGSRILAIAAAVDPENRRREMTLFCEEVIPTPGEEGNN